jgi:hypothetical protein
MTAQKGITPRGDVSQGQPDQRLKHRDRQVLTLSDFTDLDTAALGAAHAPESSKAFDDELRQ